MTELERLRLSRGLTQEAVSGVVGIAVSTYSLYENGKRTIPRQVAERIAQAVGCKVEDIFYQKNLQLVKARNLCFQSLTIKHLRPGRGRERKEG